MSYGLSTTGFTLKRLQDIKADLEEALRSVFGDIDVSPDSVAGQQIGVLSKPLADLWEQGEVVYNSQFPETADGVALDDAVTLTGITRNPATYSTGVIALKGSEGAVVNANTQYAVEETGSVFSQAQSTTISKIGVLRGYMQVVTALPLTDYTITINGAPFTIQSPSGTPTPAQIAALIAEEINLTSEMVTATDNNNGSILIESTGGTFDFDVDGNMDWWTPTEITAIDKGRITAPQGSLVVIVNPVSGLDEVINFVDVTLGRAIESDVDLRLRRKQSLTIAGAGTVEAIRSRMLQLTDVTACVVFENAQGDEAKGDNIDIPLHAIEVLVAGGPDTPEFYALIVEQLWALKPAGIQTYGTKYAVVKDSVGNDHTLYFSRPHVRDAWFRLVITKTPEETWPTDGVTQIKNNLKAYGDSLTIGNDMLYQRLFSPIYQVPGIKSVDLYIQLPHITFDTPSGLHDVDALFTALTTAKEESLDLHDTFSIINTNDTDDTVLGNAKGSALAIGDLFEISQLTPAKTVAYIGNLTTTGTGPFPAYVQANIPVDATQVMAFDVDRMDIHVNP
jgi:hypothetical protein